MIHLWKFAFYLRLPQLYFLIAAKAVNLVADVILKALHVFLVCAKVKQIKDGTRRRLHHNLARVAACGHHLHLHLLAERRQPSPVPRFDDKQVIVEFHAAELSAFGLKQMPDGRVGRAGIVREGEGDGGHKNTLQCLFQKQNIDSYSNNEL